MGKGKRAPSAYNEHIGKCMANSKGITKEQRKSKFSSCAAEWRKKKKN